MKRYELWQLQYRDNRYLENLTDDELCDKFKIVGAECLTIIDGQIGMSTNEEELSKMTHVMEEMVLRGTPYPVLLKRRVEIK